MEFGYITKFHGIPWNAMESPNLVEKFHGIPWIRKFHGTWSDTTFHRTLVPPSGVSPSFIEFHGIPWNSGAAKWNVTQFYGIPFQMGAISKGCHFKWHKCSMEFHEIYHGIFHGIPWNTCVIWNGALLIPGNHLKLGWFFYLATAEFHGIPWNIQCKSRVIWYWLKWQSQSSREFHGTQWYFIWRHQSSFRIPWNSMELGDSPFGSTRVPWNFVSLHVPWNFRIHGISWNFSTRFGDSMAFHGIPLNLVI